MKCETCGQTVPYPKVEPGDIIEWPDHGLATVTRTSGGLVWGTYISGTMRGTPMYLSMGTDGVKVVHGYFHIDRDSRKGPTIYDI